MLGSSGNLSGEYPASEAPDVRGAPGKGVPVNLFGLSPGELILISFVALIVLGPDKLPEVAGSLGKWVREFRRATEELTAQFAAENPLAELQRAFSFDEPVESPNATDEVTEEVAVTDGGWGGSSGATSIVSPSAVPAIVPRVPSYYFTLPPLTAGISPEWAHGSPAVVAARRSMHVAVVNAIGDQWAHGVPVPTLRLIEPQRALDDSEDVVAEDGAEAPSENMLAEAGANLADDGKALGGAELSVAEVDENRPAESRETVRDSVEEESNVVDSVGEPRVMGDHRGDTVSTPASVEESDGEAETGVPRVHANGTDNHEGDPIPAAAGNSREGHRQ